MNDFATNLKEKLQKTSITPALLASVFLEAEIEDNGESIAVVMGSEWSRGIHGDQSGKLTLVFPKNSGILWHDHISYIPFTYTGILAKKLYGKDFSELIANSVFHGKQYGYGITFGEAHFNGNENLVIGINHNPLAEGVSSVILFTDYIGVKSFPSTAGVDFPSIAFKVGGTGLYGLVLPISYVVDTNVFSKYSERTFRGEAAEGLAISLDGQARAG